MQHTIVADGAHWAAWAASRMRAAASTSANAGANARRIGTICDGMDAPHPGVAQFLGCALGGSLHRGGVGEFRHHAMRGHLAVGMAGCCNLQLGTHHQRVANCPCDVMAWAGMAPPWEETKSINPKLMLCTRGWDAISKAVTPPRAIQSAHAEANGWRLHAAKACSAATTSSTDSTLGTMMWHTALTGCAGNDVDIACKSGVVYGVHALPPGQWPEAPDASEATRRACSTSCPPAHRLRNRASHPPRRAPNSSAQLSLHLQALAHAELPHRCSDRTQGNACTPAWAPSSISRGWSASIISYRAMCNAQGEKIVWPLQIESKGHSMSLTALKLRAASA